MAETFDATTWRQAPVAPISRPRRSSAESVAQAAKNKNIEGATLAYMDMTMVCVRCHKHVREIRVTRAD
jgi:hypothetical protein